MVTVVWEPTCALMQGAIVSNMPNRRLAANHPIGCEGSPLKRDSSPAYVDASINRERRLFPEEGIPEESTGRKRTDPDDQEK
jgi:hypothetical protein